MREVGHISKCHAVDQAKERAFQGTITELDLAQNAGEDNLHFNVGLQLIWPCKPTGRNRVQLCQATPIKIKISKHIMPNGFREIYQHQQQTYDQV